MITFSEKLLYSSYFVLWVQWEPYGLNLDLKGQSSFSVVYTRVHECDVYPSQKINTPVQELANKMIFIDRVNIFLRKELQIFLSNYNK